MPPRFKSGLALACMLLGFYVIFWRDETSFEDAQHPIQIFPNDFGNANTPGDTIGDTSGHFEEHKAPPVAFPDPTHAQSTTRPLPVVETEPANPLAATKLQSTSHRLPTSAKAKTRSAEPPAATSPQSTDVQLPKSKTKSTKPSAAKDSQSATLKLSTLVPAKTKSTKPSAATKAAQTGKSALDEQYVEEYKALEDKEGFGGIYGQTLETLVDRGVHKELAASELTPEESGSWEKYSTKNAFKYNPYPDYNSETWNTKSKGEYKACDGPNGPLEDLIVWSGHPASFKEALGSWAILDIESNLCFERETRLGPYGFVSEESPRTKQVDYENDVDWGQMQQICVEKNSNRYPRHIAQHKTIIPQSLSIPNDTTRSNGTYNAKRMKRVEFEDEIESTSPTESTEKVKLPLKHSSTANQNPASEENLDETDTKFEKRTAVLIRTYSGQEYTENDKQNIRSLISELSLRSGGQYQVYLLVHIKEDLPIWTDLAMHEKALKDNVPKEFRSMAVLWNNVQVKEMYPLLPQEISNVNQLHWFPVQKFVIDHPEFDFYWNWEFNTHYTGHHYDLLEKLSLWSKKQFRQGLWERNERFYIPDRHASYMKYLEALRKIVGNELIWGPVLSGLPNMTPSGPKPPVDNPKDDRYKWGVREDADYISLTPMFNPVNTTLPARNDVWGYAGEDTPRRAAIGGHSRLSRKLLQRMHIDNVKGNYLSPEMAPATVSLLHGFKAVFAPIPIYFDRTWSGKSLEKYFNPGAKGVVGGTEESPFSEGKEKRFQGSTWYSGGETPMRLWKNWLGMEDNEAGGIKWEHLYGRMCLPPMILRLSKGVEIPPPPRNISESELLHDYIAQ